MNNLSLVDQLDHSIGILLAHSEAQPQHVDPGIRELLGIAAELRLLPRPVFKARLKADLVQQAFLLSMAPTQIGARRLERGFETVEDLEIAPRQRPSAAQPDILPTLFGAGCDTYPMRRSNFAISFLAHTLVIALVVGASVWAARPHVEITHQLVTDISPYILPPAPGQAGGGGGGGDKDKQRASQGTIPRLAREQFTPPAVVVRASKPELVVAPTVVAPNVTLPRTGEMGDPLAAIIAPTSNGPGGGSGIGGGDNTGVGIGNGPGIGPGWGGGARGNLYRIGGDVTAPRPIYDPDPEYSEEARKAKYQGVVVLWVVIGADGLPKDVRVSRSLGLGLDQKAVDAVRNWRFDPARKDGHPVAVQLNIEVSFRLY